MTPEQLSEIKARADAATAGPWRWERSYETGRPYCVHWAIVNPEQRDGGVGDGIPRVINHNLVLLTRDRCDIGGTPLEVTSDFQFIAHAREDIPALVAEVERLRALIEEQP